MSRGRHDIGEERQAALPAYADLGVVVGEVDFALAGLAHNRKAN